MRREVRFERIGPDVLDRGPTRDELDVLLDVLDRLYELRRAER